MICPLIGKCNEQIPSEKYINTCTNLSKNAYLECPKYKELTGGTKTPREWQKIYST